MRAVVVDIICELLAMLQPCALELYVATLLLATDIKGLRPLYFHYLFYLLFCIRVGCD